MKQFPRHLAALVCNHVFRSERPVLLAVHSPDIWQLLCGDGHPNQSSEYKVVGIGHEIEKDSTIAQLADLPFGWQAERKAVGEQWVKEKSPPDE